MFTLQTFAMIGIGGFCATQIAQFCIAKITQAYFDEVFITVKKEDNVSGKRTSTKKKPHPHKEKPHKEKPLLLLLYKTKHGKFTPIPIEDLNDLFPEDHNPDRYAQVTAKAKKPSPLGPQQ